MLNSVKHGFLQEVFTEVTPIVMAYSGGPEVSSEVVSRATEEDSESSKFVTFHGRPENLTKFLSTHKPSDPSWNKYV